MDLLTIVAFVLTAVLGVIGGWAWFAKSDIILAEIEGLIQDYKDGKEDGKFTKEELEAILAHISAIIAAFKNK